jgi:phage gp36-like protein
MYSTLDDIKKLLPEEVLVQLTDDENLGTVNQARVDEAIDQADAEIDSYCGGRYSVPFPAGAGCPDVAKKLSVDIAIYNLYSRTVMEMPAIRAERYRNAIRQLEAISKGVISLGVNPAPSAPTDSTAETNKPTDTNVFTREKLKGF